MDYKRISKVYHYVYNTPADSPEREKRLSELSDSDSEALYDFVVGLRGGRIKESDIREIQKGDKQMTYKEWRQARKSRYSRNLLEVAKFEKQNPYTVQSYKKRMEDEQKKRSEIMSIQDRKKRHDMIAKNLDLFGY